VEILLWWNRSVAFANNSAFTWREIETSALKISESLGYAVLDVVELFHEVVISKAF
jgi:hypothetical protein